MLGLEPCGIAAGAREEWRFGIVGKAAAGNHERTKTVHAWSDCALRCLRKILKHTDSKVKESSLKSEICSCCKPSSSDFSLGHASGAGVKRDHTK